VNAGWISSTMAQQLIIINRLGDVDFLG